MSTIHYHGTPIWGGAGAVHKIAVRNSGAFVSYIRRDQLDASLKYAENVAIDNGAFSAWKRKIKINWNDFYKSIDPYYEHPKLSFFVIPDVVDGNEKDNDDLINKLPSHLSKKAVPVWHLHESIDRLIHLCETWERVCFGSSGEYAIIRTKIWHIRMNQAFEAIYCKNNFKTNIHGLRMLDGRVLGNYPLSSADSTNLACNVPKFKVKYPELTQHVLTADYSKKLSDKELKLLILKYRCAVLKGAIEKVTPPTALAYKEAYDKYPLARPRNVQ